MCSKLFRIYELPIGSIRVTSSANRSTIVDSGNTDKGSIKQANNMGPRIEISGMPEEVHL